MNMSCEKPLLIVKKSKGEIKRKVNSFFFCIEIFLEKISLLWYSLYENNAVYLKLVIKNGGVYSRNFGLVSEK